MVSIEIFDCHSNELLGVNTVHGHKLHNKSQMSEQRSLLVYHIYSMGSGNVMMCFCCCLMTLSVLRLVIYKEIGGDSGMKLTGETEIISENQTLCLYVCNIYHMTRPRD
jgi:hypothetical protein